jgi:class 3 adenylate cyclase
VIDSLESVRRFARAKLALASDASQHLAFSEGDGRRIAKAAEHRDRLIGDIPRFGRLEVGEGADAWAAVLFVDLRGSSWRAEEHGARATYLAMHTYLPTMAYLVGKSGGDIVGYRGDGLFAAFGLDENGQNPPGMEPSAEVRKALSCAKAMLEAIDDAVNPVLKEAHLPAGMRVGVGIDAAKIVITNIGLRNAYEITAYGTAVNKAAKLSSDGNSEAIIAVRARRILPTGTSKHRWFKPHWKAKDGLKVNYPPSYQMLKRALLPRR